MIIASWWDDVRLAGLNNDETLYYQESSCPLKHVCMADCSSNNDNDSSFQQLEYNYVA